MGTNDTITCCSEILSFIQNSLDSLIEKTQEFYLKNLSNETAVYRNVHLLLDISDRIALNEDLTN
jgi:hypothetical protein